MEGGDNPRVVEQVTQPRFTFLKNVGNVKIVLRIFCNLIENLPRIDKKNIFKKLRRKKNA